MAIIWATIFSIIAFCIYQITKKHRWGIVGKIFGVIVLIGTVVGLGTWGLFEYQERPQVLTRLGEVSLGMRPVDVTIALGKPDSDIIDDKSDKGSRIFVYKSNSNSLFDYYIRFVDENNLGYKATIICQGKDSYTEVFGIRTYSSEEQVKSKLGEPTKVSIREDGLEKAISYKKWNVAFGIQRGLVTEICATASGTLTFTNEYSGN